MLSTVFVISKPSIKKAVSAVGEALATNFVPHFWGFDNISRSGVIENHLRPLAQNLFGNDRETTPVLDGTYIYLQYSMHKWRPLVKSMVMVTTTDYFMAILGPYLADVKNNDGAMLNHILASNVQDIKNWIESENIFIVDRGFRDSLEFLEDLWIKVKIPSFSNRGQAQMSTEEANTSTRFTFWGLSTTP